MLDGASAGRSVASLEMATAAKPRVGATATPAAGPQPADVLVVFGITGDLAKVMTFRSLYKLERRGLLDCPIVGVAVDDWSVEDLRKRARESIEAGGARGRGRVRSLRRAAVVRGGRLRATRPRSRVAAAIPDAKSPVFYLEIPPFLFGTVIQGLADAGLTENARVVVEKPFGHDVASARELNERSTSTSTSRSSTGSTTSSARWASSRSSTCGSRTRCSSRSGTATTSPACRSRWPRTSESTIAGTSTTRSVRSATLSSTT